MTKHSARAFGLMAFLFIKSPRANGSHCDIISSRAAGCWPSVYRGAGSWLGHVRGPVQAQVVHAPSSQYGYHEAPLILARLQRPLRTQTVLHK